MFLIVISFSSCIVIRPFIEPDTNITYYENAYSSDNWKIRLESIHAVAHSKTKRAENLIVRALSDDSTAVRIAALQAIRDRPIKRAHEIVKDMALYSANDNLRWNALVALAAFRDPRDVNVYLYNLTHDDWLIREAAIIGFLGIDDFSTKYIYAHAILKALDDVSISVRLATLSHLSIQHPAIYKKLISMLEQSRNQPTLLVAILNALDPYPLTSSDKNIVIDLLTHPHSRVRVAALRVLQKQAKK